MIERVAPMTAPMPTVTAARCAPRATNRLQPLADANLGDFVFFKLVNDYFNRESRNSALS
ncbi:hypothetical protein [Xanthomonas campestris]|uniref:hypothetical protein n=1 Tax=Xanthomonas campestris TaxID=339 RepID=UPI003CCFE567